MKIKFILLNLFSLLAIISCNSLKTTSSYAEKANYAEYHNFQTKKLTVRDQRYPLLTDPEIQKLIEESIQEEMKERKYGKALKSDLTVNFFINIAVQENYSSGMQGQVGPNYTGPSSNMETVLYKEGTLVIEIVDNKTKEKIWVGTGTTKLKEKNKNIKNTIRVIVNQIMSEYKYTAGSAEMTSEIKLIK
ncbi:DUF4136 domain-containing protein [Flexithrix dorotheae]|uniref:DUF4136 domain-containing protein n=1 Tax=Flexithrix dorotheae TaxID=70993 RepID=UPI0003783A4A|nr:DUF4136 domain-containing protein [Flexithrix dorotheae]